MLNGDLTSTPLAPLLLELANDTATGCLHISAPGGEADVYLKAGLVYSVSVPGSRPQLGAKLVSSGALAPEALAEALEAQRTELKGWRLGELLVHLGYVDQPVVEAFVKEQVSEALWDLLRWSEGQWKFRKNLTARGDVGPAMGVVDLLETLRARGYDWEVISAVVHGPAAVPMLSALGEPNPETTLDSDAWSMLCKIDGTRSVAELAADCGYTLFEAGHIILSLVEAGLVDIEENVDVAGQEPYGATTLASALAGELDDTDGRQPGSRDVASVGVAPAQRPGGEYQEPTIVDRYPQPNESFASSLARVSSALSDVLGDAPATESAPVSHRVASRRAAVAPADDADWERRKRQRAAAAAELAGAQALIETLRTDQGSAPPAEFVGEVPRLQRRPGEPEHTDAVEIEPTAEEAARNDTEAAARNAAEQFAKAAADEAERHAAAQAAAEAERIAAAHAATERLRAEREAAEAAAWDEQARRDEAARQAAAAEAERIAAEEAERQAQAEAERIAAEEAERQAHAAAAKAAEEARLAAEAEAERIAAEEAERQAAEAEAERVAAEVAAAKAAEAARLAADAEAERIAAEEAERQARAEAERVAAEAAERQAAEAARLAAETAEAAEAAQRQAIVEAAAEAAAAEVAAADAAARNADEAAAAAALLVELASESGAEAVSGTAAEPDEPAPAPEPEPEPVDDAAAAADADSLASWRDPETTDTAALLRELSSLGGDDDRNTPGGSAPRAPRPAAADKKVKKKIGLFGL